MISLPGRHKPSTPLAPFSNPGPGFVPTSARQLILQLLCAFAVLGGAVLLRSRGFGPWSWGALALSIGFCAGTLAWLTGQPVWWRFIHALFAPLAWAVSSTGLDPGWFLLGFVALMLVYRGAIVGRVPLYLSNAHTAARLSELAEARRCRSLVDLGAGIGSIVGRLAKSRPELRITGVENAPLTWLAGWLATRRNAEQLDWRFGSLWATDLGEFDLVYAFLSPEPMPALWQKARTEMAPGTLLVSNSFIIPGVTPSSVIEVDDRRRTLLHCYAIPETDTPGPSEAQEIPSGSALGVPSPLQACHD